MSCLRVCMPCAVHAAGDIVCKGLQWLDVFFVGAVIAMDLIAVPLRSTLRAQCVHQSSEEAMSRAGERMALLCQGTSLIAV